MLLWGTWSSIRCCAASTRAVLGIPRSDQLRSEPRANKGVCKVHHSSRGWGWRKVQGLVPVVDLGVSPCGSWSFYADGSRRLSIWWFSVEEGRALEGGFGNMFELGKEKPALLKLAVQPWPPYFMCSCWICLSCSKMMQQFFWRLWSLVTFCAEKRPQLDTVTEQIGAGYAKKLDFKLSRRLLI